MGRENEIENWGLKNGNLLLMSFRRLDSSQSISRVSVWYYKRTTPNNNTELSIGIIKEPGRILGVSLLFRVRFKIGSDFDFSSYQPINHAVAQV